MQARTPGEDKTIKATCLGLTCRCCRLWRGEVILDVIHSRERSDRPPLLCASRGTLEKGLGLHDLEQIRPLHSVCGIVGTGVNAAWSAARAQAGTEVACGCLGNIGLLLAVILLDHIDVAV